MKTTISVIKADVGSIAGHGLVHPAILKKCEEILAKAKEEELLIDYHVTNCGDDTELIMTHTQGEENVEIHELAWNAFLEGTAIAKDLKLYGAGQDLLADTFSGNIKGMGPGCAEMEFKERPSDPVVVFCCDKTEPGAFNMPLYKMFADPFTTAGLVIDPSMHNGFEFEVFDVMEHKKVKMTCPDEMYDLLALLGTISRYVIKRIRRRDDKEIAASISTERLNLMAGKYVGKDDPVAIVRSQSGFPAAGEVVEPFAFPHLVGGWMRGSHNGPLMPVAQKNAYPVRFDGPPRIMALGFQINNGELVGPVDMFDDPSYDRSRALASEIAEYMRRHGPFEPHRLPADEMEYTTLPAVMEKLGDRFEDIE